MAGGSGALYVKVGVLLYVIGAAVAVVESGFFIGAAAASGDGGLTLAITMLAVQGGVESLAVGATFLGFAIIGVAILYQLSICKDGLCKRKAVRSTRPRN
jgi:hypothetical protein